MDELNLLGLSEQQLRLLAGVSSRFSSRCLGGNAMSVPVVGLFLCPLGHFRLFRELSRYLILAFVQFEPDQDATCGASSGS